MKRFSARALVWMTRYRADMRLEPTMWQIVKGPKKCTDRNVPVSQEVHVQCSAILVVLVVAVVHKEIHVRKKQRA